VNRIICLSILVATLWSDRGIAHDPDTGQPNWIGNGDYFAADGHHCCGRTDCERLDPKLIQRTPAGIILHAYNDELVPYSQATPSEDHHYWRCHAAIIHELDGTTSGGERRCFFAPVGSQ
jgi:hypothetical protein